MNAGPADDTPQPVEWTLRWRWGDVTVQALGGMLAPLTLRLRDGRSVSPLQVAPWGADNDPRWPGVLRRLRGEWPCLPYGAVQPPPGLPHGWQGHAAEEDWAHGYTANHDWHRVAQDDDVLSVAIDYPADSPIARLERHIRPDPDAAALHVELHIHARRACQMPLALHPTFAVPSTGVHLHTTPARCIHTYPVPTEPGVSRLRPLATASSLTAVPSLDGITALDRLPLMHDTEELLQLEGCAPPFALDYLAEGVRVELDWDTAVLPDALLWFSNRGRRHPPWSGRHVALGIEPMSGFFDLGRVVTPAPDHPLAGQHGIRLDPAQAQVVSYRLSASGV
ncbi:hypothetical protein ACWA7J_02275 [Leptothrix sp. BB-4]